jgi:hypothetical protein
MKVAGFSFIRNAIKYDYPILEAITSILPICDEFVIAVGNSDDTTLELIRSIKSDKIKIVETIWDDSLREGGKVLAIETDKAKSFISKDIDWCFYIQGDECVHEKYLDTVLAEMKKHLANKNVEGLLFDYKHFYGSYDYFAHSRNWYRKEIRVVRNLPTISSYRDAQGFRLNGRKLRVKPIKAEIYHYGWVKPPEGYLLKVKDFNKLWHSDETLKENKEFNIDSFEFHNAGKLFHYNESHPLAMKNRIENKNWKFDFDPTKIKTKQKLKHTFLDYIEKWTKYRFFEYKNYTKI